MLIACQERTEIKILKGLIRSVFDMKDLGLTWKILGVEIIRKKKNVVIFLS